MRRKFLLLIVGLTLAQASYAQNVKSSLWMGFRSGTSYSPILDFPIWALEEGLANVPSITTHQMIAFDIGYQKNRFPIFFATEINLPKLSQTYPYLTSLSLESGYVLFNERATLTALVGPSLGIMTVRFRNGVPDSFQNLPYDHNRAFARAYVFMLRGSLQSTLTLFKEDHKFSRLFLLANLGLQQSISHGGFYYGENQIVPDDRFIGEPVDMVKFFKRNMWASIGLGYKMW